MFVHKWAGCLNGGFTPPIPGCVYVHSWHHLTRAFRSQRTVSFVWRPTRRRGHSHRPGTPINTPPGLAVSGKSELRWNTPFLWLSHSFTSRTTVRMTLCPSTILWAQTILRPSQSKWPETQDLQKPFPGTFAPGANLLQDAVNTWNGNFQWFAWLRFNKCC